MRLTVVRGVCIVYAIEFYKINFINVYILYNIIFISSFMYV